MVPGDAERWRIRATIPGWLGTQVPDVPTLPANAGVDVFLVGNRRLGITRPPVADAILASSQSPDPDSPFFDDQTWAYSRKEWTRLPFTPAAIKATAIAPPTQLTVPPP